MTSRFLLTAKIHHTSQGRYTTYFWFDTIDEMNEVINDPYNSLGIVEIIDKIEILSSREVE